MTKNVLGHIDCPACGTTKGMRVTKDKNGHPFGFCEAKCGQQLRVGGSEYRVAQFVALYPWAEEKPVTGTGQAPAPTPAPKPEQKPEPSPAPRKGWLTPLMS